VREINFYCIGVYRFVLITAVFSTFLRIQSFLRQEYYNRGEGSDGDRYYAAIGDV
jgi:hypothetical protein